VALAKIAPHGSHELEREMRVLTALETCPTRVLQPARVVDWFSWRELDVLVTAALPVSGCTDRPLGHTEEAALVELASLGNQLAPALGGSGATPVHGDFCGWNTSAGRGRLAAWDWEWAHLGQPLEDWFHWETQRVVAFNAISVEDLVRQALEPPSRLLRLCNKLGIDTTAAPAGLRDSLRHGMSRLGRADGEHAMELRAQALALLEGRQ
jgi:hypothetical protein